MNILSEDSKELEAVAEMSRKKRQSECTTTTISEQDYRLGFLDGALLMAQS